MCCHERPTSDADYYSGIVSISWLPFWRHSDGLICIRINRIAHPPSITLRYINFHLFIISFSISNLPLSSSYSFRAYLSLQLSHVYLHIHHITYIHTEYYENVRMSYAYTYMDTQLTKVSQPVFSNMKH